MKAGVIRHSLTFQKFLQTRKVLTAVGRQSITFESNFKSLTIYHVYVLACIGSCAWHANKSHTILCNSQRLTVVKPDSDNCEQKICLRHSYFAGNIETRNSVSCRWGQAAYKIMLEYPLLVYRIRVWRPPRLFSNQVAAAWGKEEYASLLKSCISVSFQNTSQRRSADKNFNKKRY